MKVNLLYKDKDYTPIKLSKAQEDTIKDLGLEVIITKMAKGNKFMYDNLKPILMNHETDESTILYRQEILKDIINNEEFSLDLFKLINELDSDIKTNYVGIINQSASAAVSSSMYLLELCLKKLKEITLLIKQNKNVYKSSGLVNFINKYLEIYDVDYLEQVYYMIKYIRFEEGILVNANLNKHLDPTNVVLYKYEKNFSTKMKIKFSKKVEIKAMDEAANKEFIRLIDLAVEPIYQTMYKVCNSILGFIHNLRLEFGFYISGLNLYNITKSKNLPISYPLVKNHLGYSNLCDISLGLATNQHIIGNDLANTTNMICMITGANQGGKSTFLRSLGQNFILAQCGLFTCADSFEFKPISNVFTHFNREEDSSMQSGKLDEELKRINDIINNLTTNSLVLFNESFSSTNEREGSKIAQDIINALVESDIKVFFVTHMYDLSKSIYNKYNDKASFLFASRHADGSRDYHLKHELPNKSSYALDLYEKIFD